jgi:predicted pyridoxine 5'-phosphate oxidase superfamily flavin-nucleotide-binding protein
MKGMIHLTDDVRERLASALADQCPVVAASVDADGQPHLSFYGTTQVYGPGQLAIWVRDPASSFLQRIATNPRVAFMYRNPAERVMYQFHGQGRPVPDEYVRRQVFDQSPAVERGMDPDLRGVAVLIELDYVKGRVKGEPVEMHR